MTRELQRLLTMILIAFLIVGAAAAYWGAAGADSILVRRDNPRAIDAIAATRRGALLDRAGRVLAESSLSEAGAVLRRYLYPEMASALGYFSVRYGTSGAEAAYDAALRGTQTPREPASILFDGLLHRPAVGADVRLTFDLDVQTALARSMGGQRGAGIILSVPDGAILGMVSLPTFDPNTLDQTWSALVSAPEQPFFNRAILGAYQPGGLMHTPLMAAALLLNEPLNVDYDSGSSPVTLNDLNLTCAVPLPPLALSLRDAYAFTCPTPFAALAQRLGVSVVQATVETFRFDQPPNLNGFTAVPPIPPTAPIWNEDTLLDEALGQGRTTVTPLGMASIAAAIVNDGNAPQPYVFLGRRDPSAVSFTPDDTIRPTIPITTANNARRLQDLMRGAVAFGAAGNAARPNLDVGGQVALAYSGDDTQAWFVGFATFAGGRGAAIAIVLEDSDDLGLAADIGGEVLAAAQIALANGS